MHKHPKARLHQAAVGKDMGSCGSERLSHMGQWGSDVGVGAMELSWGIYRRNNGLHFYISSHGTIWWKCVHVTTSEDLQGGGYRGEVTCSGHFWCITHHKLIHEKRSVWFSRAFGLNWCV